MNNNDLDTKIQKMQALLERWVDFFEDNPPNDLDFNVGSNESEQKYQQFCDDTKTLLKEAKEVDVLKDSAGCYVSGLNDDGRVLQKFLTDIRCPNRR